MADIKIQTVKGHAKHEEFVLEAQLRGKSDFISKNEQIFLYDRVYQKKESLAQVSDEFTKIQYRREKLYKDEHIDAMAKYIAAQKTQQLSTNEHTHFRDVYRGPFERYPRIESTGEYKDLCHLHQNTPGIIITMILNNKARRVYKEEQKVIYTAREILRLHESHIVHLLVAWRNKFAKDPDIKSLGSKIIFGEREIKDILKYIKQQKEAPTEPKNAAHWKAVTTRTDDFVSKVRECNVMGRHIPGWEKEGQGADSQNSAPEASKEGESSKNAAPQK